MSPSRGVLAIALCLFVASAIAVVRPASAQFYDPTLRSLDLSIDPIGRSPRLLGMGRLSLAVDDDSYKFDLWDYAQNPLGIFEDDTTSTAELWASSGATSSMRDALVVPGERQLQAGRANDFPLEIWHRTEKSHTAYGVAARVRTVREDLEYGTDLERRRAIRAPSMMPVMTGPFPWLGGRKLTYALRFNFGGETLEDQYRFYVSTPAGQSLDQNGLFAASPSLFEPNEFKVVTQGIGGGLAYELTKNWKLAVMTDALRHRIEGSNELSRSSAETKEKRPYGIGQATIIGRIGALELAADGRGWTSNSEQSWRFSLSGGTGGTPLAGRGKLLERTEEGTSFDARARWRSGAMTLGGTVGTRYGQVEITPPGATDPTSLNAFLRSIYTRTGVDTLTLPDSVRANVFEHRDVSFGAGAGWAWKRATMGFEYHWNRAIQDAALSGSGPRRISWDVRSGLEYRCNAVLTGRAGYVYRWADRDDFTAANEWIGHAATLGFGLHPQGTTYHIEAGYSFQWEQADFGDPALPHANRQNLATQIRWDF